MSLKKGDVQTSFFSITARFSRLADVNESVTHKLTWEIVHHIMLVTLIPTFNIVDLSSLTIAVKFLRAFIFIMDILGAK